MLHYLMPFVLVGMVVIHLVTLHAVSGNNPIGVSSEVDRVKFHPYYSVKDGVGFVGLMIGMVGIVGYGPNVI